jgi:hypothetical protein
MTENTRDLSKFGLLEIGITAELLTRYANGHQSWASDQDELGDGVAVEFNPNSGNVFLVDEDYRVAMVNDDGKLLRLRSRRVQRRIAARCRWQLR